MPAFAGIFLFIPIIFFILNIPRPSLTKKAIYLTSNTLFIIFGLRLTAYGLRLISRNSPLETPPYNASRSVLLRIKVGNLGNPVFVTPEWR